MIAHAVALAVACAAFPCAFLGLVAVAGLWRRGGVRPLSAGGDRPKLLIVVPAHNESAVIRGTLANLARQNWPADRFAILVLADNCTDDTAAIARASGVLVRERFDPVRRGKGYALADVLADVAEGRPLAGYDGVVVIDADSWADADLLQCFARLSAEGGDFAQCYDAVRNADESWRTRLLAYAFALFNGSYQIGLDRLGLGAHLRGNGMFFSRRGLERQPWRASGLAEDLEFSWRLRLAGERVHFVAEAAVLAEMPAGAGASASQRARWETGRAAVRTLNRAGLVAADAPWGRKLLWWLDLYLPPLSTLGLAMAATGLATTFLPASSAATVARTLAVLGLGALGLYLASPFVLVRLPLRMATALLVAPYYAAWRLWILLKKKPTSWIRTTRERKHG